MTAPSKAERDAAIAQVVALPGSAYTAWRQRLRHTLTKRRWAPHGFVPGAAEFGPFLAIYDALVARFGAGAEERFAAVLSGITRARRQRYNATYNAAYRARPRTEQEMTRVRAGRAAYMKRYRSAIKTEVVG